MWYGSGTTAVKRQTGPEPTSADLHPLDVAPDLVPGDRLEQEWRRASRPVQAALLPIVMKRTTNVIGLWEIRCLWRCTYGSHGQTLSGAASTVRPSLPSLLAVEGTDYGISGKTFEKTLHSLVEFGIIDVFSQCKVGE
ncbi:hypothetical protein BKA70DRAFT_1235822 [Coprinopsis sp. MPI-PUGE-AT-0042]|nr:hypothetical protein BKA70DRAFT_1235822 [Coprinopsis sp. MPI-PUGE-AT-0042]